MSRDTYRNTRLRLIQEQYSNLISKEPNFDWSEFQDLDFAKDYNKKMFFEIKKVLVQNLTKIDNLIKKYSKERQFDSLNPIDIAILRIAIAEAFFLQEVPYKVVFNEAIEIAKKYGTPNSYKYINGVLGAILRSDFPDLQEINSNV